LFLLLLLIYRSSFVSSRTLTLTLFFVRKLEQASVKTISDSFRLHRTNIPLYGTHLSREYSM